ncbi:hypothetical protein TEA_007235 [Camellia sinensis var. sinensis]|uniref:Calponin-homology (CH) domain-containing protein n=1 Tax=Camellia sinensis var. sinensis TaxID=542762 RepID=A0A4S4E648_CAMSN|nr:hypothetical protein TEA_007235 [Camellia sinensis var. sinensis]
MRHRRWQMILEMAVGLKLKVVNLQKRKRMMKGVLGGCCICCVVLFSSFLLLWIAVDLDLLELAAGIGVLCCCPVFWMVAKQQHSPNPPSSSSSLLRDISNFKTPKHPSQNPNLHSPHLQFFTASKQTPRSSSILRRHRPSLASSSARSKVSRRLKEFELEQCKSARKAQIDKEKSLKSLAKSLTVWLNFLLQNPVSCGCDLSKMTGQCGFEESDVKLVSGNGKRESSRGGGVGVDTPWRCPKRQRDSGWRGVVREESTVFSNSKLLALQSSLRDVCSFDDLKERMKVYLSLGSCKEIFNVMTQVTKNIDEGRLKMKPHCPIVTDVGLKEKASRILMCYNPIWLRIGLYIIFGGDSLLSDEDINSEKEIAFLKMVIEKQFFSHAGLARVYAYNKLVEGLYRPGYFEALGNVILKRFLLLVLVLDRAKSQSCLPIKYGIDGLDGGSPLLFTLQPNIKSSCQLIHDFLSSDVMHGEGNVLAHLLIVGYKVSYLQSPFNEYDFRVKELFEDLQDGVRLCRAIQLLQHDASILMKMLVPSDTRKKNVVNCGVALQHLKQAGVPLFDGDGSMIVAEDIVSGDKELTLSLLWNIFVHLQLPLLINKTLILEEISRIQGVNAEHLNNSTLLDMLLNWIQAICKSYDFKVDNFASLVDGKAMWCLLDYYFRKELNCSCSLKDIRETSGETSIMSVSDYTDAVHNFILSQKLTTLLGNFPEVLQVSDILEHNGPCNSQSVIILLVFLSFQLLVRKNTEQLNFHKLLGFTCQSPERRRLSMDQCFAHSEAILNQEDRHVYNTEGSMLSKAKAFCKPFKLPKKHGITLLKQMACAFCAKKTDKQRRLFMVAAPYNSEKVNEADLCLFLLEKIIAVTDSLEVVAKGNAINEMKKDGMLVASEKLSTASTNGSANAAAMTVPRSSNNTASMKS